MKKRVIATGVLVLMLSATCVFADELKDWAGWTKEQKEEVHEVMDSTDWHSLSHDLDYGNLLEGSTVEVLEED